jgi:GNAT superfamily N-acetyltransferase
MTPEAAAGSQRPEVAVRALRADDLDAADRILRVAFGTFLGLPDPTAFLGDADLVRTRFNAKPDAAFAAEVGGQLVGTNFAANWGSVGFFGPLTVSPDLWDAGVGKRLMDPVMRCFERWGTRHAGLFTFAHSVKHVSLYQRFGFWPGHLTAILSRRVEAPDTPNLDDGAAAAASWTGFSQVAPDARPAALGACRELTGRIYDGLDVAVEVLAVAHQELGDTILVSSGSDLEAFAVCHTGPATEAGSDACYVKFAAVRPGSQADGFGRLLDACSAFALARGASRVVAGVNTARHEAYRALLERGFRTEFQGVAMHRGPDRGYARPDAFVLDDWR